MELPLWVTDIGDLLEYISSRIEFKLVDADREKLRPDVEVLVNGRDISFYPKGLKTCLRNEDLIDVALMPLGGG